jgi:hypothetical protein
MRDFSNWSLSAARAARADGCEAPRLPAWCVRLVVCRVVRTARDRGNLRAAISVADAVVMGGGVRSLGDSAVHKEAPRRDRPGSCSGTAAPGPKDLCVNLLWPVRQVPARDAFGEAFSLFEADVSASA